MKINLPNFLTILRVLAVPVFIVFAAYDVIVGSNYIALIIFILASLTDWFDGYLARKNKQVTNFGKIMDPLADKLLVIAALLCLLENGMVSVWVPVIILLREFLISGIRIAAAAEGNVIAASMWGKVKTVWQFGAIILALFLAERNIFTDAAMWIAAALTLISGIDYLVKNIEFLKME